MSLPSGVRAVVTGGGSGLGAAFCERLALGGAEVLVADIDIGRAEQTAERVRACGAKAHVAQVDVADAEQMQALADQAACDMGGVELVANNAGVAVAGRFEEVSLEDWQWIMGINLWGVIHGCRVFAPGFKRQGRGYIINVASAAGLVSFPEMSPYNTTKRAVVGLSETLSAELRRHGVNVTVLCPTFFRTRIMEDGRGASTQGRRDAIHKLMDRSRLQAPEVAQYALDAVAAGKLYAVPMRDGRMMWRLWRSAPESVQRLVGTNVERFIGWIR